MKKKNFRPRHRKVQQGITEIRYGEEWNEYKLLTPEKMREYKKNPKKYLKLWRGY